MILCADGHGISKYQSIDGGGATTLTNMLSAIILMALAASKNECSPRKLIIPLNWYYNLVIV